MLDLPKKVAVKGRDGVLHNDVPMWRYWQLEEGVIGVEPGHLVTNNGAMPPVMQVDTDAPLQQDVDGSLLTAWRWGITNKQEFQLKRVHSAGTPDDVTPLVSQGEIHRHSTAEPPLVPS